MHPVPIEGFPIFGWPLGSDYTFHDKDISTEAERCVPKGTPFNWLLTDTNIVSGKNPYGVAWGKHAGKALETPSPSNAKHGHAWRDGKGSEPSKKELSKRGQTGKATSGVWPQRKTMKRAAITAGFRPRTSVRASPLNAR